MSLARCVNPECEAFESDRPIELVTETVEIRADDLPITISSTHHLRPVNDEDLACPQCGFPSAILDAEPKKYAKLSPG